MLGICPHCHFPLAGGRFNEEKIEDAIQLDVSCSHCKAILRVTITTLKDPDPEDVKRKNESGPATTTCPDCQEIIIRSKESEHQCKFYRPKKAEPNPLELCPHGFHINDPVGNPGKAGNCLQCRSM